MLSTEERDALNRGGVRGVIEQRAEVTDNRIYTLESHVDAILGRLCPSPKGASE